MAASTKFDPSPGSPDRPIYSVSQCESFTTASMQRSGSFREGSENPVASALPHGSRSSSAVTMGEVMNFIQNLHFDMKSMSGDNRCQRLVSSVFGVQPDDPLSGSVRGKLPLPSSSWEELKRAKASVREGSMRARERLKVFHHAISSFNKCLPNIQSRKRSRSEILSTEKSGSSSSCDRSLPGPNAGKKGAQGTNVSKVSELEQQNLEERTKKAVPNKRTRTSLTDTRMDVRNNSLAKPHESMERNSATQRLATTGAVSGDILRSVSVDGWEKARMKKKRSAIKADASLNNVSMKIGDGCRETSQGLQQRPVPDGGRSRIQNSQGFRPGISNGTAKGGTSLQSSITSGPSALKADQDNASLDKKDRNFSIDKERMKLKGVNKPGSLDDFSSASPTPCTKLNASVRAPRSMSVSAPKSTHTVNRAATLNDWELSNCSNKVPDPSGTDGKRASSTTSSSPPAHWAGQRSQKNCRPARKPSFLSVSPSYNEAAALESMSDVASIENGSGFAKGSLGGSPKHIRLKEDHFSSTSLSESEDSANVEFKFSDKKCEEQDDKPVHHVQRTSPLVPPGRKNKLVNEEKTRDILRKQSRSARSHIAAGSVASVRTAKQLRAASLGLQNSESKGGRPVSRKLSDRKAYTRQKHSALNPATDFVVGVEDCNEELRTAARAVINPFHALSSAFWKQMETYFRSLSDNDIAFLRQQENQGSFLLSPNSDNLEYWSVTNGCNDNDSMGFTNRINYAEPGADHLVSPMRMKNGITLCQRLLAALIPEEEGEALDSDSEDLIHNNGPEMDEGFGSNTLNQCFVEGFQYNAFGTVDDQRKISSMRSLDKPGYYMAQSPVALTSTGSFSSYCHLENGILELNDIMASLESAESKHDNMPLDGKILFEIETARLFPEGLLDVYPPEDDEILADINYLVEKYQRQVVKKDKSITNLLKLSTKAKEIQKKNFEACVLDQLVAMAYGKYMASRSLKSSATSKAIKQAALSFVKRTLERCHTFEHTGKSCFSEPSFFDKFLASPLNETQYVDTATEGESARPYDIISNGAFEASVSQKSPSLTSWSGQNLDIIDIHSSDVPRLGNISSELTTGKEDALSNSRVKKRELSLDEVGRSGIGNLLSSSTKGKRSERDREGKNHGRETISKQGTARAGRASCERKLKAKPKQRMTQLSASVNGLLGKLPESPRVAMSQADAATSNGKANEKDSFAFKELDATEATIDLSGLQLPGMDVLGVTDDLDGQGQDFDSWLNIEEDGLQDFDIMGLEIPMDDLSELNMMV